MPQDNPGNIGKAWERIKNPNAPSWNPQGGWPKPAPPPPAQPAPKQPDVRIDINLPKG